MYPIVVITDISIASFIFLEVIIAIMFFVIDIT